MARDPRVVHRVYEGLHRDPRSFFDCERALTEWPDAEYHDRKRREAALGGKSAPAGTSGRKTQERAPERLKMHFGDE